MKTYRDLLAHLQTLAPEQLDQDVTVFDLDTDEYRPLFKHNPIGVATAETNDVLDTGHVYLII
jgi:hypothetical protein